MGSRLARFGPRADRIGHSRARVSAVLSRAVADAPVSTIAAFPEGGGAAILTPRMLEPGHFVASMDAVAGQLAALDFPTIVHDRLANGIPVEYVERGGIPVAHITSMAALANTATIPPRLLPGLQL